MSQAIHGRNAPRDEEAPPPTFHDDVVHGLSQHPKQLLPKYFYDRRGSELFDAICGLDEYYLTRCEWQIMQRHAAELAASLPPDGALIEFGSGSSVKTRLLLDQLPRLRAYVPVDISADHLAATCQRLRERYPQLTVLPTVADFTQHCRLPPLPERIPKSVYFPGSTIGNFELPAARRVLRRFAEVTRPGGRLLIGVDLQKDRRVIEAAYNDRQGVTAAFNRNLLDRINRELGADFHVADFAHEAHYDEAARRIEMRLRCRRSQTVHISGDDFHFESGEAIHTESSHKYSPLGFNALANAAGFKLRKSWFDDQRYFAVLLFDS